MSRAYAMGVLAATALALPAVAAAQTEDRFSADVAATAGYSNNPFTLAGNDTGAGVVTVDIAPRYQVLTPRSTFTASVDANLQQYLSHYGYNGNYSGAVDYQGRPSEHVTAHARIDLSSAVLGTFNNYFPVAPVTGIDVGSPGSNAPVTGATGTGTGTVTDPGALQALPSITPLAPYTDVGLYGTRSRRQFVEASAGFGFTISTRDTVSVDGYAEASRYSDAINRLYGGDFNAAGGSVGWQRRLSANLSAGLSGSAATYDYLGGRPDSQVYSIQATASARFSDRWSGDGALGVSFVNGGSFVSTHSTSLSGNIDLCRRGPYSVFCLQAARQVSPTGYSGTQYVTTAGFTWNRRLDERQSVSLGGSYSKVGGDDQLVAGGVPLDNEYATATAGYNRRLGLRLSLVASATYRKLFGYYAGRPDDYGGQLGLSYRFGDRR